MCLKDIVRLLRVRILRLLLGRKAEPVVGQRVLILAPHPDDEVLGCGGLIHRLLNEDRQVDVVIMSGGGRSHSGCCDIDGRTLVDERRRLTLKAAEILGMPEKNLHFMDYPDGSIMSDNPETERLRALMTELNPDTLFVPHSGEGWSDHTETRNIGLLLAPDTVTVYEYCVWFWYYNTWNIDRKNAYVLKMTGEELCIKNCAIDAYILPQAPCGRPYSGVLPPVFVKSCRWNKELYFKVR